MATKTVVADMKIDFPIMTTVFVLMKSTFAATKTVVFF